MVCWWFQALLAERDALSQALDDAHERILLLERTAREQEQQLRQSRREMAELRRASSPAPSAAPPGAGLATSLGLGPTPFGHGHRSLLDEMECDDSSESGFVSTSELHGVSSNGNSIAPKTTSANAASASP